MIFLRFGTELINLGQVYQIDLRKLVDGSVVAVFFYHLADTTAGGHKTSKAYKNEDDALNALVALGINIRPVDRVSDDDEYYDSSLVPTGRVNTRIEPSRRRK